MPEAGGSVAVKNYDLPGEPAMMLSRDALRLIQATSPEGLMRYLANSVPESNWTKVLDELGGNLRHTARAQVLYQSLGREILGLSDSDPAGLSSRGSTDQAKEELLRLCRFLDVHPLSVAICATGTPEESYENFMSDGPPPSPYSESLAYHLGKDATGLSREDRSMLMANGGISVGAYRDTLPAGMKSIPGALLIRGTALRLPATLEEVSGDVRIQWTSRFRCFPKSLRYIGGDVRIEQAEGFEGFSETLEVGGRILVGHKTRNQGSGLDLGSMRIPEALRAKVETYEKQ
jgi:hypothetical protein